ncbi:MAG: decarboxylating 6-phosphogluconate dehydrogenase [Candidatus Omnitrophica bacterium]|nr:decarboxylating 6-phosphogluconate dehydrogenase [Candidatus Omnitrophota bacterium]
MEHRKLEFGVIGLGRMGGNLALQALEKGLRVVGFTRGGVSGELTNAGLVEIRALADFTKSLSRPRSVFLYIPAGPSVDQLLDELAVSLEPGDIVVDGGNSYWGDSIRRYRRLKSRGLHAVDLGTSGGVEGARHGACFMAGGERDAVLRIEPILKTLAVAGGCVHAGGPGAGHFTKLVHNGIEFGMLQAIGEGVDLLEHFQEQLNITEVLRCWRHGSVIRSWLIDLMEAAYRAEGGLAKVPSYVDDTGEVNWLVNDAMRMEVPIPVIAQAVMQLFASRDDQRLWARAIAMMRHGFGGHAYGPSAPAKQERIEGRVGDFYRQ